MHTCIHRYIHAYTHYACRCSIIFSVHDIVAAVLCVAGFPWFHILCRVDSEHRVLIHSSVISRTHTGLCRYSNGPVLKVCLYLRG